MKSKKFRTVMNSSTHHGWHKEVLAELGFAEVETSEMSEMSVDLWISFLLLIHMTSI
jgi:hypothetical protein